MFDGSFFAAEHECGEHRTATVILQSISYGHDRDDKWTVPFSLISKTRLPE